MTPRSGAGLNSGMLVLALLFAVFLVTHAVIVFSETDGGNGYNLLERTWGFDHFAYFSFAFGLVFYAIGVLLIMPPLNLKLGLFVQHAVRAHRRVLTWLARRKILIFWLVACTSGLLFWLLRFKYDFLGDTLIRPGQTLEKDFHLADYGSMVTLFYLSRALGALGLSARQAFVSHSIAAGIYFVFMALLVADLLGKSFLQKAAVFLFSITVGAVQQYFGYPEVYAIPAAFWITYIYLSILYLKGRVGLVAPLASLALGVAFHLVSLALIPSLLVLIHHRYLGARPGFKRIGLRPVALIFVLALPLVYFAAGRVHYGLIPVLASSAQPSRMTLFSIAHVWEFFNSQLLASGSGIFLFCYVLYEFLRGRRAAEPILAFLVSISFSSLLLLFVFNPTLGSNDWDLYTFPAIAYNLAGIYYLVGTPHRLRVTVRFVVPILIFLNLMNLVPWVLINASDRSVERIEKVLPTDPGLYWESHPPTMHLAVALEANGLYEEAFEYYKKYHLDNPDDMRGHFNYAKQLLKRNQRDEGIRELEKMIAMSPYCPWPYQALVVVYEQAGDQAEIYDVVRRMFDAYLRNPRPFRDLVDTDELLNYLEFLHMAELDRGNQAEADTVGEALEAASRYFDSTGR
jgi:tetratricopeptide (TPR) repeat protein